MHLSRTLKAFSIVVALGLSSAAHAHCDTVDGPVVSAARKALDSGNVNLVLVWVKPAEEAAIRSAFEKARVVRRAGAEAKQLADDYFFETLVRLHRAGEGADYTGLKPAGQVEPAVAAADAAIASGNLQPLAKRVAQSMEKGLHGHFDAVMAKRRYDPNDVAAGRAYASAYVEFVHYAERLDGAAQSLSPEAGTEPKPAHAH